MANYDHLYVRNKARIAWVFTNELPTLKVTAHIGAENKLTPNMTPCIMGVRIDYVKVGQTIK